MRFILYYQSPEKTRVEVEQLLPKGAQIVDDYGLGIFLVEGRDSELKDTFPRDAGWTLQPEQFGHGID